MTTWSLDSPAAMYADGNGRQTAHSGVLNALIAGMPFLGTSYLDFV